MCKEDQSVILAGVAVVTDNKSENAKGHFRIQRKGKTRRDNASGAHANLLKNRADEADNNRKFHGK